MRFWCVRDSRGSDTEQPRPLLSPPLPVLLHGNPSSATARQKQPSLPGWADSRRPLIGRRWQVRAAVALPGGGRWLVVSRTSVASRQWMVTRGVARERRVNRSHFRGTLADMLLINIQPASAFDEDTDMKVSPSSSSTLVVYRSISSTWIRRVAPLSDTQELCNLSATRHLRHRTWGVIVRRAFSLKTNVV